MLETSPWARVLVILLVCIAGLYLAGMVWQVGSRFSDTILLFGLAWFLAFLLRSVARFFAARRLPWLYAVATVYLGLSVLLVPGIALPLPVMVSHLQHLPDAVPGYLSESPHYIQDLEASFAWRGLRGDLAEMAQRQEFQDVGRRIGSLAAENALVLAQTVASFTFHAIVVLFLSFYIMLDGARLGHRALEILPLRYHRVMRHFMVSVERSFGGFVRGAAVVSGVYGLGIAALMLSQGLSHVVPVSAAAAALLPPLMVAAFTGSLSTVFIVTAFSIVLQPVLLNFIQPKVMDDSVGIHHLVVFLALFVGAREAGFWRLIFAVPVAAVLNSMAVFLYEQATGRVLPATPTPAMPSAEAMDLNEQASATRSEPAKT